MTRGAVKSSALESVGYSEESQVLEVEIKNTGRVYQYFEVPLMEYLNLINAPSVGEYYNEIKKKFLIVKEITTETSS
jgi:hypothetical protein